MRRWHHPFRLGGAGRAAVHDDRVALIGAASILVPERGDLGEVVNDYGGATAIEPSCDGIVAAVTRLSSETAWKSGLAQLQPVIADTYDQWIDEHEAIYGAATPIARAL